MNEGSEASNCCFNEEIRLFGSILELECMHYEGRLERIKLP